MKPYKKLNFFTVNSLSMLCVLMLPFLWHIKSSAQNVTISSTDLVNLKNEIQALKDSINTLKNDIAAKDILIEAKNKSYDERSAQYADLQVQIASLKADSDGKDSIIHALRSDKQNLDEQIQGYSKQLQALQEVADRSVAKLANGRLYYKYDAELVRQSIQDLRGMKTEQVQREFAQVPHLLQSYESYSQDVKITMNRLQNIDTSLSNSKHKVNEYRQQCMSILKQSTYYQNVYVKKGGNVWSIPYLDVIIDAAKSMISKHNPVDSEYANFFPLVEML